MDYPEPQYLPSERDRRRGSSSLGVRGYKQVLRLIPAKLVLSYATAAVRRREVILTHLKTCDSITHHLLVLRVAHTHRYLLQSLAQALDMVPLMVLLDQHQEARSPVTAEAPWTRTLLGTTSMTTT
jgi:hypothetical protein